MYLHKSPLAALLSLLLLVLTACGQTAVSPTAVPQPTVAPTATAQPTAAAPGIQRSDAEMAAKLDDFLSNMTKERLFSGIVTVRRNNTVVFQKAYGFADRGKQVAFTSQTVFPIGEMSLQFTAAATLLLEQQGKLSVQDPICNYITPCPEPWKPITLHHLLSHTSGIPDYLDTDPAKKFGETGATPDQIVALFRDKPLEFVPGAKRVFSRSGFVLLGLVIEKASGQSYGDFMRQQIFDPLGMQQSGYGKAPSGAAVGYYHSGNRQATYDVSALYAAGGLYTTSDDMLRWVDALYGKKLLNATELEKMLTNHATFGDDHLGSGYGIVLGELEGHPTTGQCGGPLGYGTCVVHYLQDSITIMHFGNQDNVDIFTINDTLEKIVLGVI